MRKKIGVGCILAGMLCLLAAVGLVVYNHLEAQSGAESAHAMLEDVRQDLVSRPPAVSPETAGDQLPRTMSTIEIDGNACIGVLTIPALELELPVLTDWSYEKLKKAPCHYYGSCYGEDFVIAAHNYRAHFGRLSELRAGDTVVFTDAEGVAHHYAVVLLETLPELATEEMITSGFDLSLYTCTTGGASRVTVRCGRVGGA